MRAITVLFSIICTASCWADNAPDRCPDDDAAWRAVSEKFAAATLEDHLERATFDGSAITENQAKKEILQDYLTDCAPAKHDKAARAVLNRITLPITTDDDATVSINGFYCGQPASLMGYDKMLRTLVSDPTRAMKENPLRCREGAYSTHCIGCGFLKADDEALYMRPLRDGLHVVGVNLPLRYASRSGVVERFVFVIAHERAIRLNTE